MKNISGISWPRNPSPRISVAWNGVTITYESTLNDGWALRAGSRYFMIEAALQNDLFVCVLAAINLINNELEMFPVVKRAAGAEWSEFRNTVEWIRRTPNRDDLALIENTFVSFGNAALAKQFTIDAGRAVPIKDLKIKGVS